LGFIITFLDVFSEVKKMSECEECGKKLGIFEGYQHPTLGKKHHLCSPCYEEVDASVARWREFIQANSFNNGTSKKNFNLGLENIAPKLNQRRSIIENVCAEIGIIMRK